jgi:pSer/pThr/pTyr-binding forkhead associated (FHA) protein
VRDLCELGPIVATVPRMAAPSAIFEVVAGKAAGMSIVVEDELVIGRNADGAGKLAEDGELSRSHARIALDGNGFCAIEDLGSTNGTFVNGLRISAPQTLSEGDTVELGGTTLVVRTLSAPQTQRTAQGAAVKPAPDPQTAPAPPAAPAPPSALAPAAEPTPAPAPGAAVEPPAEPAQAEKSADAAPSGKLSLHLEVDFSTRETRLLLDDVKDPVRLVYDDGVWRFAPPPTTEKRGTV